MSAGKSSGGIFDQNEINQELNQIETELADPENWQKPDKLQQLGKHKSYLEKELDEITSLTMSMSDLEELLSLIDSDDTEALVDLQNELSKTGKSLKHFELSRVFSQAEDKLNAFIEIQSGSGGTEAQDWANMLLRMYQRFCESQSAFDVKLVDHSPGEVAGIKTATLSVSGPFAFGYLKTESGIHRLVRKSPFDSGNRRHTSFASVFITPEVDENIEINIEPQDLRIDTYRASGAGGQHVNTTDSAVRITHIPTGIVAQCQNERSQHQNKAAAMNMLRSKLFQEELNKKQSMKKELEAGKDNITWGQQIRSYVLDQSRIKDLRTGFENTNTQSVLDGDLMPFIEASLLATLQSDKEDA